MVVMKDSGIEISPGIEIPWGWVDGILCSIIEKGEAGINNLAAKNVTKLNVTLQALVDNNSLKFDNVGKDKVTKAITLAFASIFNPGDEIIISSHVPDGFKADMIIM